MWRRVQMVLRCSGIRAAIRVLPLVLLFVALSGHHAEAGPISTWYLTAGDQGTNWMIQGASASSFPQHHPENQGEYAVAVSGDVRTLGNGNTGSGLGSQYTLAGVYTGTDYAYPNTALRFYDGATDGTYNYSVDYGSGAVYRMDRDWSNPSLLFNTG